MAYTGRLWTYGLSQKGSCIDCPHDLANTNMNHINTLPEVASLFVLGVGLTIIAFLLRKKFPGPQSSVATKEPPGSKPE